MIFRRQGLHAARFAPTPEPVVSQIEIIHPHARSPEQTRQAMEEVAAKLRDRHGLSSQWQGDAVLLSGAGINGRVEMLPGQVRVVAELGFLLSALSGMVESEIRRVLQDKLG
jgi:putative polyhydroxyalkanoate system protein